MGKKDLADYLRKNGVLQNPRIIETFEKIDRADFVRENFKNEAYGDYPLSIGFGQTISQPTTVAFMLELLEPEAGDKILDLGSGSGWTTALLAYTVSHRKTPDSKSKNGYVYGVEKILGLVEFGQNNLAKYPQLPAKILQAGKKLGLPEKAPFDKILVSASAEELPKKLIDQLKIGGVMTVPIRNSIFKIIKTSNDKFSKQEFAGFVFVPLINN